MSRDFLRFFFSRITPEIPIQALYNIYQRFIPKFSLWISSACYEEHSRYFSSNTFEISQDFFKKSLQALVLKCCHEVLQKALSDYFINSLRDLTRNVSKGSFRKPSMFIFRHFSSKALRKRQNPYMFNKFCQKCPATLLRKFFQGSFRKFRLFFLQRFVEVTPQINLRTLLLNLPCIPSEISP